MDAGYKRLDVCNLSYELSLRVHTMSLGLPKFEMYEEGSQIRRSAKSICANMVEGYALRKYKNEYLRYLSRAYGSCEETIFHLDELFGSGSLADQPLYESLISEYRRLSSMIFNLIQSIGRNYETPHYLKEPEPFYDEQADVQDQIDLKPET